MNIGTKTSLRQYNLLDLSIIMVVFLSIFGFCLARAGHAGVNKVIRGQTNVDISVFIVGLKTMDNALFKPQDKVFITIRNQPVYPALTILDVKQWAKQISFLSPDGKKAVSFTDPTQPLAHDFLVTVSDLAEVTEDGYVVRGNKIKIGNQIELESFKYRVQGVVVNIQPHQ